MSHKIVRTNDFNCEVELFVDGKSEGIFPTEKKALMYLEKNSEDVTMTVSDSAMQVIDSVTTTVSEVPASPTSDIASQKTDEVKPKRRGRPKRAGNDRTRVL